MTLALEYRPQSFTDVVGHESVKPILRAMVKSRRVPPALIFSGTRGTGKTTVARVFAAALNCPDSEGGDCCSECKSCKEILGGTSLSAVEIDAASHGAVSDIQQLKELVSYVHESMWRVVTLDEAHSLSREAFNSLLKVLEEPPANTVFILVTTELARIPETVQSRTMKFDFRMLSIEEIVGRLHLITDVEEDILPPEDGFLAEVATYSRGSMRDAVMLLDQASRINVCSVEAFRKLHGIFDVSEVLVASLLEESYTESFGIIEGFFQLGGDPQVLISSLVSVVRDVLIIQQGGEPRVESMERSRFATQIPTSGLVTAMRLLWEMRARFKQDSSPQASMEMSVVMLGGALKGDMPIPTASGIEPKPLGARKLSLEEIQANQEG